MKVLICAGYLSEYISTNRPQVNLTVFGRLVQIRLSGSVGSQPQPMLRHNLLVTHGMHVLASYHTYTCTYTYKYTYMCTYTNIRLHIYTHNLLVTHGMHIIASYHKYTLPIHIKTHKCVYIQMYAYTNIHIIC